MENIDGKQLKCLTCKKKFNCEAKTKPFCSQRCSYIDLNNWLGEKYCVQVNEEGYETDI
ncbi:DNA gyrase inhibitor YacG [Alphaproteobacteria bacterium]|nr:DNA gyrase inhibitor YacG [Alphaproteobacteria bacterium]